MQRLGTKLGFAPQWVQNSISLPIILVCKTFNPLFSISSPIGPKLTELASWSWDFMDNFNMYAKFDLELEIFLDFLVSVQNYFWHLCLKLYIFLDLSLRVGHICLVLHWILIFVFFIPYTRGIERKLEAWIQYNTPNYPILGQCEKFLKWCQEGACKLTSIFDVTFKPHLKN
jgi:hypothetical protein